jgi:hypothetical protein
VLLYLILKLAVPFGVELVPWVRSAIIGPMIFLYKKLSGPPVNAGKFLEKFFALPTFILD